MLSFKTGVQRNAKNELMCRVCSLRLDPNFGLRQTADNNFYLWLTVEKVHAFAVFTEKYLRSYGCSGTNFMAVINCTNPKTEIQIEIIETEITRIQIYFESDKLVCL